MARRSKHSAQKRRRELARAEKQQKKRDRRANPIEHDSETLISEYLGQNIPGEEDVETSQENAAT